MERPKLAISLHPETTEHETKSFRITNVMGNRSDDSSTRAERQRHEWPRLIMKHRSFVMGSAAEFHWTIQTSYGEPHEVKWTSTPSVTTAKFSTRHFQLNSEVATSLSPAGTVSPTASGNSYTAKAGSCVNLVEVFLSRAIELECESRSCRSPWTHYPRLRNRFAWEYVPEDSTAKSNVKTDSMSSQQEEDEEGVEEFRIPEQDRRDYRKACTLEPATMSDEIDPRKINVRIINASSADLNEVRWLLASVANLDGATLFTRVIERRQKSKFHLVFERNENEQNAPPIEVHKFVLTDPWRVAWKWIDRLAPSSAAVRKAYLAAVGLTWAPVPLVLEASWIYELHITARARAHGDYGDVIDVASGSGNTDMMTTQIIKHLVLKGFVDFLWNVVRFWQGLSSPLDLNGLATAPNEDLSGIVSLNLKRLASLYAGGGWMANELPIGALVVAAWSEIGFKHPVITYAANDMKVLVPNRVSTVLFTVNPELADICQAKGDMFVNGYKVIAQQENRFQLGISSAGLILSAAFFIKDIADRNKRQKQTWLFDICRGGSILSPSLAIVILACSGTNIAATYDETHAKYFGGVYPFASVCEFPRSCFYQSLRAKQHRLKFSTIDPEDPRGEGLRGTLKKMEQGGGLLCLQCFPHACFVAPSEEWPVLLAYMTRPMSVPVRRLLSTNTQSVGWLRMESVSPGVYHVKDLPLLPIRNGSGDKALISPDGAKISFCRQVLCPTDIIEVFPHTFESTQLQTLDVEPILLPSGVHIDTVNVASLRTSQVGLNSLSMRSTTTGEARQRYQYGSGSGLVSDDGGASSTRTVTAESTRS